MRHIRILAPLLALCCTSARAVTFNYDPSGTDGTENITITCVISGEYADINWSNLAIDFNNTTGSPASDWKKFADTGGGAVDWRQATGADLAPTDGAAIGLYEAFDTANVTVHSNAAITMTVADGGDLKNGTTPLPTQLAVCATPNGATNPRVASVDLTATHLRPGTALGSYAGATGTALGFGASAAWPGNPLLDLDGSGSWVAALNPITDADFVFFARVQRDGLNDPVGNYSTTVTVTFGTP